MSIINSPTGSSFADLGISPNLLAVLNKLKFTTPTPIQQQAIPVALKGADVIGIAQTGTGKSLAFAIPLLQYLGRTQQQGLIILPTRELAIQVDELLEKLGHSFGLRRALLIGGGSIVTQKSQLRQGPHVIIGTPGRIIDHLEQRQLHLQQIGVLVLDEADRMLDMGFAPQINRILEGVPRTRQTMLFSATMPSAIVNISSRYMHKPVRIEVARAGTVAERVEQAAFIVAKDQKNQLLDKLLGDYPGTVLVFSRTKYGAKRICRAVHDMGHTAAEIHSNLSLAQRRKSLEGFKTGRYRVLVATDIAARGIDVTNITLVVNYDIPDSPDDYVHRVGRTGRAGQGGQAISFVTPDQRGKLRIIERLVRQPVPVTALPTLPPASSRSQAVAATEQFSTHRRVKFRPRPERSESRRWDNRRSRATSNRSRKHTRVHT